MVKFISDDAAEAEAVEFISDGAAEVEAVEHLIWANSKSGWAQSVPLITLVSWVETLVKH